MASESPIKADITTIFKRLRSNHCNKICFDCGANNPTWASVTYGVFLCIDCSAVHRSLGVHVTFIRSTQLDTTWTWLQLRAMQTGGNANATAFFRQHGCTTKDSQQKYHSRAAQMYREKLHGLALKATKQYGTKLHIDAATDPTSPEEKEVDFFKEHVDKPVEPTPVILESQSLFTKPASEPVPISNGSLNKKTEEPVDPGVGPSVDAALSMSPTQAQQIAEPRKATIGARKPASAKKGNKFGAKKGLGAQKVRANFSDLENAAQQKDKDREQMAQTLAAQREKDMQNEEKRVASVKLAYKDLSLDEKKRGERMKNMDPKKAAQMERLGMGGMGGGAGSRESSHSAFSDMTTIKQETPTANQSHNTFDRYSSRNRRRDDDDEFEIVGGFSSGPPRYDSPYGMKEEDRYSNNWGSSKKSSWDMDDSSSSKSSTIETISTHNKDDRGGRSRKNFEVSGGDEAQKKFGNAKAISSDAYFGNKETDYETKSTLSKFEGQSSISSADFYGGGPNSSGPRRDREYQGDGPDLSEIKEGVRQGVTKVAGRLSNIANGVMNSIQRKS